MDGHVGTTGSVTPLSWGGSEVSVYKAFLTATGEQASPHADPPLLTSVHPSHTAPSPCFLLPPPSAAPHGEIPGQEALHTFTLSKGFHGHFPQVYRLNSFKSLCGGGKGAFLL